SFLTRAAAISPHDPPETILHGLEVAIARAAPGHAARIAVVDETTAALTIGDDKELLSSAEVMAGVVETQTPRFVRTAAGAILAFSGLLSEQLADWMNEKQKRFLRNIQEAGDHLLDLINDVLDLSKVEAGRLDLRPEIVTLDALLEPVSAAARTAAQAKGVLFTIETCEAPSLFVDPTRVRQVLFNLVSNAV